MTRDGWHFDLVEADDGVAWIEDTPSGCTFCVAYDADLADHLGDVDATYRDGTYDVAVRRGFVRTLGTEHDLQLDDEQRRAIAEVIAERLRAFDRAELGQLAAERAGLA